MYNQLNCICSESEHTEQRRNADQTIEKFCWSRTEQWVGILLRIYLGVCRNVTEKLQCTFIECIIIALKTICKLYNFFGFKSYVSHSRTRFCSPFSSFSLSQFHYILWIAKRLEIYNLLAFWHDRCLQFVRKLFRCSGSISSLSINTTQYYTLDLCSAVCNESVLKAGVKWIVNIQRRT